MLARLVLFVGLVAAMALSICAQDLPPKQDVNKLRGYLFSESILEEYARELGEDLEGVAPDTLNKILKQKIELIQFKIAVLAYVQRNNRLPEKIEQAIGPETGIERAPRDLFRPGKSAAYRLSEDKQEAVFYSFGPDGKDDGAQEDLSSPVKKDTAPAGDIIDRVNLKALAEKKQEEKDQTKDLYSVLAGMRKKTGRDNAMIYYVEGAGEMIEPPYPSLWADYEFELIKKTLADGWGEEGKPLIGVLARYEPAIARIRKGIALDDAVNTTCLNVPDFVAAQKSARLICIEGRRLESASKPAEALSDYLSVMTMGRDYGRPDCALISGLISVAVECVALPHIMRVMNNHELDRQSLESAATRLKAVEDTQGKLIDWYDNDYICDEKIMENRRKIVTQSEVDEKDDDGKPRPEIVIKHEIEADMKILDEQAAGKQKMYTWNKAQLRIPYWKRDARGYGRADYQKQFDQLTKNEKEGIFDLDGAEMRCLWIRAQMREARAMVALEIYKRDKGAYPDKLEALVPGWIEAVPVDPFDGKPVKYEKKGKVYRVWSVGPDMKDDVMKVSYDPTNGTVSAGDIFAK